MMLTTNTRRWLAAAAVLLGLVAFYLSPEGILRISEPSRPGNRNGTQQTPPVAPNSVAPDVTASSAAAPGEQTPSDGTTNTLVARATAPTKEVIASRTAKGAPVQLQVQVPSDVQVGEVFQAQVHVQASAAIHQIEFAISYDKSRLALVGSSAGNFAKQAGASAEFGAEEPSDGNIQVSLNARGGASMAGVGSLGQFEFQAIKRGTSPIVLQNLTMFDGAGAMNADGTVLHEGRVTIH
jgi:hypothetical protein